MSERPAIDRAGQHVRAHTSDGEWVTGVVDHSTEAPQYGETQHIIEAPDDGRRPVAVRESEIRHDKGGQDAHPPHS